MRSFICRPRNDNNLFLIACVLFCVDALYSVWAFISSMQLIFGLLFILAVISAVLFFLAYLGRVSLIAPYTALALRLLVELLVDHAGRGGFFGFLGVLTAIYTILCLGGIIRFDFTLEPAERLNLRVGKPFLIAAAVFALLGLIAVLKCLANMNFGVTVLYVLDTICLFGGAVLGILALEEDVYDSRDEFLEFARNADLEDLMADDELFEEYEEAYEEAVAEESAENIPSVDAEIVSEGETFTGEMPENAEARIEPEVAAEAAEGEQPEAEAEPEEYTDVNEFIEAQNVHEAELRQQAALRRRQKARENLGDDGLQIIAMIRKLAELRDQGIVTEAEFEKKKKELLRRL